MEVDNHGRVVRLLKEVPPVAGKDIYLTLDLHLQQYIEGVLKGQRAAVVAVDPRDGGCWRWSPVPAMTRIRL